MGQPSYTFNFTYRQSPSGSDRGSWNASFSDFSQIANHQNPGTIENSSGSQPRGYIEGVEETEHSPAPIISDINSSLPGSEQGGEDGEYHYDWYGTKTPSGTGSVDGDSSSHHDGYTNQPGDCGAPNYYGEGPYTDNPIDEVYAHEGPVYAPGGRRPVIAVMGRTGSGKTSFIKSIAGDKAKHLVIGKDLHSCTHEVEKVTCTVGGMEVDLIDTPGFDDTKLSDTEVLARIADYLKYTYDEGIRLTGLIYLYPISNNRMDGSAIKYLNVFRALCGDENLGNVILATTMWSKVSSSEGKEREANLKNDFWRIMIDHGSTVERVSKHQDPQKDKALVERLLPKHTVVLQLQQEMSEGKKLAETTVGSLIFEKLTRRVTELEKELELTQAESKRAIKKGNKKMEESFRKEIKKLEKKLKSLEDEKTELTTRQPARVPKNARGFWKGLFGMSWTCVYNCGNRTKYSGFWQCENCGGEQNNTRY